MNLDFLGNKKFLIIVIILILGGGGFFYWHNSRLTPPEEWDTAEVSPREDYVVKETPEGKVVENEKVGLRFEVPEGWKVEENTPSLPGEISFLSPNANIGTSTSILREGCRLKLGVAYIKTDFETFKKVLEDRISAQKVEFPSIIVESLEVKEVDNFKAVYREFRDKNLKMSFVRISFPAKEKIYEVGMDFAPQDKEKCEVEFNEILNTVSID